MKARIAEIFSSIQGEGLLIGRRQIFIRFAGCNLNCKYCDTLESQLIDYGNIFSLEEIIEEIEKLKTPDLHSISFTGGEPLLHVDIINEIIKKTNMKSLLETNGTLTEELKKLNKIDFVSLDIKLPEHFTKWNDEIFENEINSLNLLISHNINVYCKLVVFPSTKLNTVEEITKKLSYETTSKNNNVPLIIQPASPIDSWKDNRKLFEISEIAGKYMDVLIIPQVHKFLNIE